jgi:hypothetical protein
MSSRALASIGLLLSIYAVFVEYKVHTLKPGEEFTALCDIDALQAKCRYVQHSNSAIYSDSFKICTRFIGCAMDKRKVALGGDSPVINPDEQLVLISSPFLSCSSAPYLHSPLVDFPVTLGLSHTAAYWMSPMQLWVSYTTFGFSCSSTRLASFNAI